MRSVWGSTIETEGIASWAVTVRSFASAVSRERDPWRIRCQLRLSRSSRGLASVEARHFAAHRFVGWPPALRFAYHYCFGSYIYVPDVASNGLSAGRLCFSPRPCKRLKNVGTNSSVESVAKSKASDDSSSQRSVLLAPMDGLQKVFPEINFLQATASNCAPSMQKNEERLVDTFNDRVSGNVCRSMIEYVYGDYLPSHPVDRVLLASRWEQQDLPALDLTIRALSKRGSYRAVLWPHRAVRYGPSMALAAADGGKNEPGFAQHHREERYEAVDAKMAALARDTWKIDYVSYFNLLCHQNVCVDMVAVILRCYPIMDTDSQRGRCWWRRS